MSDAEHTPGPQEQAVLDRFAEVGWRSVTMDQVGPDGTEVLAMLMFHLCPVCATCVPLGTVDDPFPDLHRDYHLAEAQRWDEAVTALKSLLGMPRA